MARINLSISDELKEQMEGLQGENWSKVAQDAFAQRVAFLNNFKGADMQEAGLERLRASRETYGVSEFGEGAARGKRWALKSADYGELQRVSSFMPEPDDADARLPHAHTLVRRLADKELFNPEAEQLIAELFGTVTPSSARINGFISGAYEVFAQV